MARPDGVSEHPRLNESLGHAFIGTAGWSIPRAAGVHFTGLGTHLQRYARTLRCAEINSTCCVRATRVPSCVSCAIRPGFRGP